MNFFRTGRVPDYAGAMRSILTALFVFLVAPPCLISQKAEADLRARLIDKPLYLRGEWGADKLAFDAAGHPEKTLAPVSFTLAGVDIRSVKLTSKGLVLGGQRVGLEFEKDVPKRVRLEGMTIRIKNPVDGDFTAALNAIFVDGLADLVPQLPPYWQIFAQKHLASPDAPAAPVRDSTLSAATVAKQPAGTAKPRRVGGGVTPPRLATKVDPEFSETARAMKYSGIVLVNLIVDKEGKPNHLQILRPLGLGLDEQALAAVSRYTFQPAMEGESPVAVELNVEVNFQIF